MGRGDGGWDRGGLKEERGGDGEKEEEEVPIPEYAHAVNSTCKVTKFPRR